MIGLKPPRREQRRQDGERTGEEAAWVRVFALGIFLRRLLVLMSGPAVFPMVREGGSAV